jgi:ubiquinone/menaquinone biosynthesis C-methylase UbiE
MNRRERRIAVARSRNATARTDIAGMIDAANRAYHEGHSGQAEAACRNILAHAPANPTALNLLGLIHQSSGRHTLAIKEFAKAIAADELDAACHYNIASSFQILQQRAAAAAHFSKALALGLSGRVVEEFVMQNADIADCARLTMERSALPVTVDCLGDREITAIANDVFLQCAMQSVLLRGVPLEFCLTHLRFALLRVAEKEAAGATQIAEGWISAFCALARQCFINEYVYAQSQGEAERACRLRDLLLRQVSSGNRVSALLLAAVAAYFPLHSLASAEALLAAKWPHAAATALLGQQVREPFEEAEDRHTVTVLTATDDNTSLRVMRQYEENPFPRWTIHPLAMRTNETTGSARSITGRPAPQSPQDILIAGCGTGKHAFDVAEQWPRARILAIDISLPSLAYARRKTREAQLRNIEYAQADILNLGGLSRSFDHIEAIGVLHHLADPNAGWRVLLGLLRPKGTLRVGLYSEAARRTIVDARALIADRGYPPTPHGIRALRRMIIGKRDEPRWSTLLATAEDFYSMSGCRDLFFNVMEHRFTIPAIAAALNEHRLAFLGFEVGRGIFEKFQRQYPQAKALTDLDCWNAFEAANPQAFRNMYVFSVCKAGHLPEASR